jgi:hypothetical protein
MGGWQKPRVGLKGAQGEPRSGAWQEFPRRTRVIDGLAAQLMWRRGGKTSPGPHTEPLYRKLLPLLVRPGIL